MATIPLQFTKTSNSNRAMHRVLLTLLAALSFAGFCHASSGPGVPVLAAGYGKVPLSFEPNRGQTDPRVRFFSRGQGYGIFLTPGEAVLALHKSSETAILRMTLQGANANALATPQDRLPGASNYFLGSDPRQWTTDVPTYARVNFRGVYPGVDLVYYGNQRQLEYDFLVAPNADPRLIALSFTGASPKLDAQGNLLLSIPGGQTTFHKPVAYQIVAGHKIPVAAAYTIARQRVTFALGAYDHAQPLVIDPVLTYASYLGGSLDDRGTGIAADAAGNAYITGDTVSLNFPLMNAFQSTNTDTTSNGWVAFVSKLNPAGTALVYSTFLGGIYDTHSLGIAVDSAGSAYIGGYTSAGDYPVTSGAFQTICGANYSSPPTGGRVRANGCSSSSGNTSGFITKLTPAGNALSYSTFLSGDDFNQVTAIAVDAAGEAYVVGNTNAFCGQPPYYPAGSSYDAYDCFPVTASAIQDGTTVAGGGGVTNYGFFTKLSADGSTLLYSTILGPVKGSNGTGNALSTDLNAVAVDTSGNAYVAGFAGYGIPTTPNAFYVPPANSSTVLAPFPAYVAKINPAASGSASLVYSTFLGSAAQTAIASNYSNVATGIAADASGNAYVTGYMNTCGFPTTAGAYDTVSAFSSGGTCNDSFVTKLNPAGTALVWSTLLGTPAGTSSTNIALNAIALGSNGNVYVVGTAGQGGTYPAVGAIKPGVNGGAVLSELDPTGSKLLFSTYISGYSTDYGTGVATDVNGNMYVTGRTYVGGANSIPTTSGALQTSYGGGAYDAFVVKIAPAIVSTTTLTLPTGTVTAGQQETFSATVAGPSGTTKIPTGTVTFLSGSTTLGTATLNASGVATFTASSLNATTYNVTASYPGDSNFSASVSSASALVVSPATPTVKLTAPASATVGASVTLSVAVTGTSGSPTGTVVFKDGTTTLSTMTLASGAASYSTTSLAVGAHSITVSYSGDSIFGALVSAAQTVTINAAPAIAFAASPTSLTVTHGASGTVVITGTPVGGYTGTATFACGTLPAAAACLFSPTSLVFSGTNTAQSTTLTVSTSMTTTGSNLLPALTRTGEIVFALLLPLGLFRRRNGSRNRMKLTLLLLMLTASSAAFLGLTGCGSSNSGPTTITTPAGAYSIAVTVTSPSANATITVPVVVQ